MKSNNVTLDCLNIVDVNELIERYIQHDIDNQIKLNDIIDLVKLIPNDQLLGETIRELLNK